MHHIPGHRILLEFAISTLLTLNGTNSLNKLSLTLHLHCKDPLKAAQQKATSTDHIQTTGQQNNPISEKKRLFIHPNVCIIFFVFLQW